MDRRTGVVGLATALVIALAGCSSKEGNGGTPSNSVVPAPSPSASLPLSVAAERDALVAYRGMWSAFVEAGKTSDPDAPDLRKYASDNALKLIVRSLYTDRDQGKVTKGPLRLDPKATESKPPDVPTEVKILDCVDSTNWLEYKKSGELWDKEPGSKHRTTATVKLTDGVWKVSSFILEGGATC
ncbi:hypothetical protein GCM10020358_57880 [Amorphoplanes nipponensis]|uniref:Uncharacterized protein n=1 Tax=Actinoplanes nipponensis TaxID=135950 RepID=A0A919MPD4_9ACTN|nr:hypothetical protein [Actinoplanes nipponensis]GIE52491.1 hypothetical protein Ani05nite_60250 [Actinoplanes nipponensis]